MKNSEIPAMPVILATGEVFDGLTKREMFAMHAMQGILANCASEEIGYTDWAKNLASHSVGVADALLEELDKE